MYLTDIMSMMSGISKFTQPEEAHLNTGVNMLLHEKHVSMNGRSKSEGVAHESDGPPIIPIGNSVVKDSGAQYKHATNHENSRFDFQALKTLFV